MVFRAGKMTLSDGMLRADTRRGLVVFGQSPEDELLHLTWTCRENGVLEDDCIIGPGLVLCPI